jgi:hypothetical protein
MFTRELHTHYASVEIIRFVGHPKDTSCIGPSESCSRRNRWHRMLACATILLLLILLAAHALVLDINPTNLTVSEGDGFITGGVRLTRESGDPTGTCSVAGFVTFGGTATTT